MIVIATVAKLSQVSVVGRLVEQMIEIGHYLINQFAAAWIGCVCALRE
jgi:hypothetical protein